MLGGCVVCSDFSVDMRYLLSDRYLPCWVLRGVALARRGPHGTTRGTLVIFRGELRYGIALGHRITILGIPQY
jgi:hypothetical protein